MIVSISLSINLTLTSTLLLVDALYWVDVNNPAFNYYYKCLLLFSLDRLVIFALLLVSFCLFRLDLYMIVILDDDDNLD